MPAATINGLRQFRQEPGDIVRADVEMGRGAHPSGAGRGDDSGGAQFADDCGGFQPAFRKLTMPAPVSGVRTPITS